MGGTTQTVERLLGIITVNTNQIPPDTSSLDISRSSFSTRRKGNAVLRQQGVRQFLHSVTLSEHAITSRPAYVHF